MTEELFVINKSYFLCELQRPGPYSSTVTKTNVLLSARLAEVGKDIQLLRPAGDWCDWKVAKVIGLTNVLKARAKI